MENEYSSNIDHMVEEAKNRASLNGNVVGLVTRVVPVSHGKENKEIRAEIPFETYLNTKLLVGTYLGISTLVAGTLMLGRVNAVERSDILAVSKVPAISPVEDVSGITTSLVVTIELLSEEVGGEVVPPSSPVDPQSPIFIPGQDFIKRMLGIPTDGVEIGNVMEGYRELNVPVRITQSILRHHMLVVGTTGAGKTNLLRLLLKRSEVPVIVYDIQGDYVRAAIEGSGHVLVPIPKDMTKDSEKFLNIFMKRTNLKGNVVEGKKNKFTIEVDGRQFQLHLVGFPLHEVYKFLPEVFPFFSPQGGMFFKIASEECMIDESINVDNWMEKCGGILKDMKVYHTTIDNIDRSLVLLRDSGVIDSRLKDVQLEEPDYRAIMNGKTVVDLRWTLERGVQTATMSSFIITKRIFDIIDERYRTNGEVTPYLMIFDEAHEYFPQGRADEGKEALEKMINRIMRLGRVRGIGTVLATHRPTDLNDLILTLTNTKVALRADEDALKKIGMDDFSGILQASPPGYGVMRTFSMKVHDLIFRTVRDQ